MNRGIALGIIGVLGIACCLALGGCTKAPPPSDATLAEPPALPGEVAPRPTEFVVLIDNSKSIRPAEQVIIREATMLLSDLADPNDRIAVITFGEDARVVAERTLVTDQDREAFKAAVRDQVDFSESFSDIRAGVRVLAQSRDQLLPTPDAVRAAILFTDGKLEPKDQQTQAAFEQIQSDLSGPLAGLSVYAVVLGDSFSRQPIPGMTALTGVDLMRRHVASSDSHFYHALDLEELPDIAVTILNDTKGIASLGEEGGDAFRIDSTVELMNLIVRKRASDTPDGDDLPLSGQIELRPPESAAGPDGPTAMPTRPGESIYRNNAYAHFDLFVVRNPRPGIWRVVRTDGMPVRVLSKIVSPVTLQVHVDPDLYVNAAGRLRAWLYDERRGSLIDDGYDLQVRIAEAGALAESERYLPLQLDPTSGRFGLDLPAALFAGLGRAPEPGVVEAEILARKADDPWFTRRSPPLRLAFGEPLVAWHEVDPRLQPIPFLGNPVAFGATLDKSAYQGIGFEAPASLDLFLDRFDPATGTYRRIAEQTMTGIDSGDRLLYQTTLDLPERGAYRYGYLFSGQGAKGPVRIPSLPASFTIDLPWLLVGGVALALLILLELLSLFTAKLRGSVQVEKTGLDPGFATLNVTPRRELRSSAIHELDLGSARFRIRPRRHLFLSTRLCLAIEGVDARLDGAPLKKGTSRCVPPRGKHALRFVHVDGDEIEVTINLRA